MVRLIAVLCCSLLLAGCGSSGTATAPEGTEGWQRVVAGHASVLVPPSWTVPDPAPDKVTAVDENDEAAVLLGADTATGVGDLSLEEYLGLGLTGLSVREENVERGDPEPFDLAAGTEAIILRVTYDMDVQGETLNITELVVATRDGSEYATVRIAERTDRFADREDELLRIAASLTV